MRIAHQVAPSLPQTREQKKRRPILSLVGHQNQRGSFLRIDQIGLGLQLASRATPPDPTMPMQSAADFATETFADAKSVSNPSKRRLVLFRNLYLFPFSFSQQFLSLASSVDPGL
jgi:hypothetical protein